MNKLLLALACTVAAQTTGAAAQVALDRADPTIIQRSVPQPRQPVVAPAPTVRVAAPTASEGAPVTGIVRAVTVVGQGALLPAVFADVIAGVVGHELGRGELARLAGAIAAVARTRGYPLASATVGPQSLANGILRVTLDLGRIDAVRVIGGRSALADRILAHAIVKGAGVRQADLERALLLVGDIPGVRVVDSRYVRQDGFGILLVTIATDRASAYLQVDNRGSKEVGPVRSTMLASVRSVATAGDELAVIVAQTPLQLSEFSFVRGRYTLPVGASGTAFTASGSYARSEPGGFLRSLHVVGRSADIALGLQHPLLRSRAQSLWVSTELRALGTDQMLAASKLRRDRLVTLTGALNGEAGMAGGALRAELTAVAGLPIDGTTRVGSSLASRTDGDARFVTASYFVDWTKSLGRPFSIVLASAGQIASRPLLATAEIGAGGPQFGRAYDYAERTGDQGVLGSAELRADTGRIAGSVIDRAQVFAFVDGGTVKNLRNGIGGGSLLSAGAGARVGTGRFDWLVEVALPLNHDRFDTGDRRARLSLRVARRF